MQRVVKSLEMLAVVFIVVMGISVPAEAKTKKVTMDLKGNRVQYQRPAMLDKAKKVKVKSSQKSVVSVKYRKNRKDRRIAFTLQKKGNAAVTVRCILKNGQKKTIRYKVTVTEKHKVTDLEKGKKAFAIQNSYRREKGSGDLEWSDEIYEFCLYRLKNSGLDGHENLRNDINTFFGNYGKYRNLLFSENLTHGIHAEDAMKWWKGSTGHYANLTSTDHVCGAIAVYRDSWCALFLDVDKSVLENWKTYDIKEIRVKRYDTLSGSYLTGSRIVYYEQDNKEETQDNVLISDSSGISVFLEAGKTYVFYEQVRPEGYDKAEKVTLTVESDGEVTLSS
jgi:uncharacterized protein YkwD